jgi:hypothetical protein
MSDQQRQQQMIHRRWSLYLANFANAYINAFDAVEQELELSEKQGFRDCFGLFAVTTAAEKENWISNWIGNDIYGIEVIVPMRELLKFHNLEIIYQEATHDYRCEYRNYID